jgi:hypothetical protein
MGRVTDVPDHWHVATSRDGTWRTPSQRYDRAAARRMLRDLLVRDGRTTGDPAYEAAVRAVDGGYDSYCVGRRSYVAFACACPRLPIQKGQQHGAAQVLDTTLFPVSVPVRGTGPDGVR